MNRATEFAADLQGQPPKQEGQGSWFDGLTIEELKKLKEKLTPEQANALVFNWDVWARPNQKPPAGDWDGWLILAGRGAGKTRTATEWVRAEIEAKRAKRVALIAETSADGRDVLVEGESGILAISPPWNKPLYEPSKRRITWPNGAVATLYDAREPDQLRGPQHDLVVMDEWCLTGSCIVNTYTGPRQLRTIRAGDMVWTRQGLKRVLWAGRTQRAAPLWQVDTSIGSLIGTKNHPIFVEERGFVPLHLLQSNDTLYSWHQNAALGTGEPGISTRTTSGTATVSFSTEKSIKTPTENFLQRSMSTIRTAIQKITTWPTWKLLPRVSTFESTPLKVSCVGAQSNGAKTPSNVSGLTDPTAVASALSAGVLSRQGECAPLSIVQTTANRPLSAPVAPITPYVTCPPRAINRKADVYNLEVKDCPEFFANGILVHNCKYRYYEEVLNQVLLGLRLGKKPRWLITTTPRPLRRLRELIRDKRVVVMRYSTMDNIKNLAPSFRANVIDRYQGTRIGRQEIEAEILEDVPGALWNRRNLDENRVARNEVPALLRVAVAVDPSVTSGDSSNETGIVVGGMDQNQHGYVIEDCSLRGSPDQWARRSIAAYRQYEADSIIAESNQGGELVEKVIHSIAMDVPVKLVRASRGKFVRAEPVSAFYEQNKISHVGTLAALEDQMISFTPEAAAIRVGSDHWDRVDALVWLWSELFNAMTASIQRVSNEDDAPYSASTSIHNRDQYTGY